MERTRKTATCWPLPGYISMIKFLWKHYQACKNRMAAIAVAASITLVFLLVSELLIQAEAETLTSSSKLEAIEFGNHLRSRIDRELNSLLFISNGLASYLTIYHKNIDPGKVNAILADLYSRSRHVRNLAIAVGYRITYIHPLQGNQKALGLDYREIPDQWPQVEQAVKTGSGVLAGPVNLVQGGRGLIYRYPVYIDGEYWGIISTVINVEPFLQAAFMDVHNAHYEFAIRAIDSLGKRGDAFYGDPALFDNKQTLKLENEIPNGKWEWALLRKSEDKAMPLIWIMRLMAAGISILLGAVVYRFIRERTKLTQHALYDSLTGLANRRLLDDRMNQALIQAKRFNRYIAIMFIDLDHFKSLNDGHGHAFGDEFLKIVAQKLVSCIRKVDTLSRVGGDEFVILLEEIDSPDSARIVAENILSAFKAPITVAGKKVSVSLSIGIAIYQPISGDSADELMRKSDLALYEVKARGRNGYSIFKG
ncbi:putative signaling protein [Methylophilaceae bacterium]|nr:putative signaling protein [Methylophilaceae bacterium]